MRHALVALVGLAAACGTSACSADSPPDQTSSGAVEARVLADLAETNLLVTDAALRVLVGTETFVSIDPEDLAGRLPSPVYSVLESWDALPDVQSGCFSTTGTWTDADGDGIPAGYEVTMFCPQVIGHSVQSAVAGRVALEDLDDDDPERAAQLTWDGFEVAQSTVRSADDSWRFSRRIDGTLVVDRFGTGWVIRDDSSIESWVETSPNAVDHGLLENHSLALYGADDKSDAANSGTIFISGQKQLERNDVVHTIQARTVPTLHYSASCKAEHPGLAGYDGGAIEFRDGSSLMFAFHGCGDYSVTYDGIPLPL